MCPVSITISPETGKSAEMVAVVVIHMALVGPGAPGFTAINLGVGVHFALYSASRHFQSV